MTERPEEVPLGYSPRSMGAQRSTMRGGVVALIVAVCLVAANMRPTITAIGPLLDEIGADTGLAAGTLGLITAVPLLAWAMVSPLAHELSRRVGLSGAVLLSLLLLTVGTVVRSLSGPSVSLWLGTALIGVALAVVNVLMPAVIKRDFPQRVTMMMAVYTALLGGLGAVASGVAVPISHAGGNEPWGWRTALLLTGGVLLPIAILAWVHAYRRRAEPRGRAAHGARVRGIWRDPVAWIVAGYMGFQASTFYMLVTWLATISQSIGRSPALAGVDVMIYQVFSLAGSLALPLVLRPALARWVPAALPVVGIVGAVGLMIAPEGILVWGVLLGLFSGASLGMTLTLIAQRAHTPEASAALSGMSQSVGYVIAAIGPVAFGALHAATGGWTAPLALLLLVMLVQAGFGIFAGRERFVLEQRP